MLNPDTLMRVTEGYAEGFFEELFEREWTDAESFIRSASDYIEPKYRQIFAAKLREALAKEST